MEISGANIWPSPGRRGLRGHEIRAEIIATGLKPIRPMIVRLISSPAVVINERGQAKYLVSRFAGGDPSANVVFARHQGESGARKPSGQNPPPSPPELALPERYDGENKKKQARAEPQPKAQRAKPKPKQVAPKPQKAAPKPKTPLRPALKPKKRRYNMTAEQEVAMLQRDREAALNPNQTPRESLDEHLDRLSRVEPLPTFDAPGVYERGPERPGEGSSTNGGGKFRSVDAFGLKYFSYLIGVEQKIELVFSIPFFQPRNGRVRVPIVGFTIKRNGELSEAVLLRSSGYQEVDRALLDAVRRAAPYGPFPEHLPDPSISIRVFLTS